MNHEMAETDQQKAEMFNTYFSSQTKVSDTNKALPTLESVQDILESITIITQDVLDVLKQLDVSKACGPDLISPRLFRVCADYLAYPYSIVFNRSLAQGYFPNSWMGANLSPIHKKKMENPCQTTIDHIPLEFCRQNHGTLRTQTPL